jgi:hypothetical protein
MCARGARTARGRATVGKDLTWIGVVLRAAKSIKQLPINPVIVDEARTVCRELRLIAKSRRRDRRPTPDDLVRQREFFTHRDHRAEIPMNDIVDFALHSSRSQAEICRLRKADNDNKRRTGLVRDAKHPKSSQGGRRGRAQGSPRSSRTPFRRGLPRARPPPMGGSPSHQ